MAITIQIERFVFILKIKIMFYLKFFVNLLLMLLNQIYRYIINLIIDVDSDPTVVTVEN